MLFSEKTRNSLFKIFTALFLVTAGYHIVGIFYKVNESPVWRHLLFTAINLFCVYGILKRPKYFIYLMALLIIQQYYSHGTSIVKTWIEKKQVDWISVFVLLFSPIVLICLIEDGKLKSRKRLSFHC